ncbi:MAG: hypothetical protein JWM32_2751 [Verrucomicrobia bacterium]|nr:hypothetical protein [Verrucomicrobiota bacterium]
MKVAHLTIISACTLVGFWWGLNRSKAVQLQAQLEALHQSDDELAQLRREHERLSRLQPSDDELADLRRAVVARATPRVAAQKEPGIAKPIFPPGVWIAPGHWENRGRATPDAAVETMLWAAAGGDVAALKNTLEFDQASRAQAAAIMAKLPETSRRSAGTPEDLLAFAIAGNVPLESVQPVAQQQSSEDEVVQYMRFRNANGQTRQVYLTLHRAPDGWKLRVPPAVAADVTKGM